MTQNKDKLYARMRRGGVIITPNNRLSKQLLHDYYHQQRITVDKPHCVPYQAFLRQAFNRIRHAYPNHQHPILLNDFQQDYLWRDILTQQDIFPCSQGLLLEVKEAWTRCQLWQIEINPQAFSPTTQTQQFQQWCQQFQQRLNAINAITEALLVPYLLRYIDTLHYLSLLWVCFDDYTPQQLTLQKALESIACQQEHFDLPIQSTQRYQCIARDQQDEYALMLRWLQLRLDAGDERIGVVIPNLQNQHQIVQRLLQRTLAENQFNISLGKTLIDYPLVAHALSWLSLDKNMSISHHQAELILQSPYLGSAKTEFMQRSQALQDCRIFKEASMPFQSLLDVFHKHTPQLAQRLTGLTEYPEQTTVANWVELFKARLVALGFPGEYALNSPTYQCFQRLLLLFDEFLQLTVINEHLPLSQAIEALQELAKSTLFQTQTSTTPIQILGLLEASGCTFDSLWVCGLTDQCLPQKTNLSAFIPFDIQRQHKMPHALPERELQFAKKLMDRLCNCSPLSIFSYPSMSSDTPNLPSPFIANFPEFSPPPVERQTTASQLIPYEENYAISLTTSDHIGGGTSLLANQAMCPFRAFAAHRLHANSPPEISTGPDASERGQILHKAMEIIWLQLENQQKLLTLSRLELNNLINQAIQNAINPMVSYRPSSFSTLIQEIEISRLERIINACLEWDKQRPAFEVEALEKSFSVHLAEIPFQVRMDRLDRLENGSKWVIDYKTTLPTNKPWNEDRPEAPQLLLYAILDPTINALLFLQLKTGNLQCSGLSELQFSLPGMMPVKKTEQWNEYQSRWFEQLTALANEFRMGHCPPQPTRISTCARCEFQTLCRIYTHST
jgi:ATP-dependent helicase/nuclease subunit B